MSYKFLVFILLFFLLNRICDPLIAQQSAASEPEIVITGKYTVPNCPEWLHQAVFYQIYPQTFYDCNEDGISINHKKQMNSHDLLSLSEKVPGNDIARHIFCDKAISAV